MFKIAIVGPESAGKTELTKGLADYFNAPWVPEYAREYIEALGRPYTYDDVCHIARTQIEQEKSFDGNTEHGFVFFDTELIITKVWFEYKYKLIPDFLTNRMSKPYFDLYLLCVPDLPWKPDRVREHGNDREFFYDWYKTEIEQTLRPYVIVNGNGSKRIQNAIEAISSFIKSNPDSRYE